MECKITAINSYPVKSCRAISMQEASLSETGIEGDRQLMILRDGELCNQKSVPELARVNVRRTGLLALELSCEGRSTLKHSISIEGDVITAELYGSPIEAITQGGELADWFSSAVGVPLELVAPVASFKRIIPLPQLAGLDGLEHTGFVDVAPLLLTSEDSLADLNSRLDSPIAMSRFRANIVVSGMEAWAEDDIAEYRSGDLVLKAQAHCERCAVTCTDQLTGERFGEPLRTLRSFRKQDGGYSSGILFGEYLSISGQGKLAVGDVLKFQ